YPMSDADINLLANSSGIGLQAFADKNMTSKIMKALANMIEGIRTYFHGFRYFLHEKGGLKSDIFSGFFFLNKYKKKKVFYCIHSYALFLYS
ncbi:MAG: hypothetical protein DLD55_01730, partial [candidate division SR1 bacterium]